MSFRDFVALRPSSNFNCDVRRSLDNPLVFSPLAILHTKNEKHTFFHYVLPFLSLIWDCRKATGHRGAANPNQG